MTFKEEVEQDVINKSVKVDVASQRTTASLPLMNNPSIKFADNKEPSLKVYNQQIKKFNQNIDDKKMSLNLKESCNNLALLITLRI